MKYILLVSALVVLAQCMPTPDEIEKEWQNFKNKYHKNSVDPMANDDKRRQIFADNYLSIVKHNSEADKGLHTYRLGVNQFADMTADEFKHKMLGLKVDTVITASNQLNITEFIKQNNDDLPTKVDWTPQESRVKNQEQCGSCFAFAAIDTIESHYTIRNKTKIELSPQNIIDCLGRPDVCQKGGTIESAYDWVNSHGGVESEQDYPYQGRYQGCSFDDKLAQLTVSGYKYYYGSDEDVLKSMVAIGPVAVAIHASNDLQHYKMGIYSDSDCNGELNHGVVVVGYGREGGQDYWLIKNSWDTTFGLDGYFKLARNQGNMCKVGTYCLYPTGVRKPGEPNPDPTPAPTPDPHKKGGNALNVQCSLIVLSLMIFVNYILN